MELATKNTTLPAILDRKDKDGHLKAEDFAACQKCYSHSVHDKGGNISNLISHILKYMSICTDHDK